MEPLVLYLGTKTYSTWSLRAWLALRHTGAPFSEEVIALYQSGSREALLRRSPSGRVPALRHGDLVIWDSLAICEYVAELFPEARLWPADRAARALARSVSSEMHSGFTALRNAMSMDLRREIAPIAHDAAADADISRVTSIWNECRLAHGGKGEYLFGHFTIADAMFAPVVTRLRTYAVPLTGAAAAYAEAMWRHPGLAEWVAAAQAESLPG
ncbi:glutathione S-transferase family protein [Sorangium sp. So ce1078]|uniref:glutathione S-transferase family protein n=1 Tax=Sorangium sp. So ce1078 TaxID=3133329 RepID=UPI003F6387DE